MESDKLTVNSANQESYPLMVLAPPTVTSTVASRDFYIVGIGASAGGLDAFRELISELPATTGMSFVVIQHLDPSTKSQLPQILSEITPMTVCEVVDGVTVVPNVVYVIPPNCYVLIADGRLHLTARGDNKGSFLPIDLFLKSLARDRHSKSIGIILSGNGTDGTLGIAEIKNCGGILFAQNSCQHNGMPKSAVDSGYVDFVLPPKEIGQRLLSISQNILALNNSGLQEAPLVDSSDTASFENILTTIKTSLGVDFSLYRDSTIKRRIFRRAILLNKPSLAEYSRYLTDNRVELELLYQDLLISVTNFFRDPDAFVALKEEVFPEITKNKGPNNPIRIWVAGCSTGQEAYSILIALQEYLESNSIRPPVQLFATDLNDTVSLEIARRGLYPESIESEVSEERLRRFFTKEAGGYRISKFIREMCIFAKQNITSDPPFSKVDLISCRNVLIYLSPTLQKNVIPTFHYALNLPGYLLLGSAESVGTFSELFEPVDKKQKIYAKRQYFSKQYPSFSTATFPLSSTSSGKMTNPSPTHTEIQQQADAALMDHYTPPGVLINENLDVLYIRGKTEPYVTLPRGEPRLNILRMVPANISLEIQSAIEEVKRTGKQAFKQKLKLVFQSSGVIFHMRVVPVFLNSTSSSFYWILFEAADTNRPGDRESLFERSPSRPSTTSVADGVRGMLGRLFHKIAGESSEPNIYLEEIDRLQKQLSDVNELQKSLYDRRDAALEEVKSANEEIMSSNEELQSTNEELETAKEELQSVNEELRTVNDQLNTRNQDLTKLNDDLTNIQSSSAIPQILLGRDLRIRRLTPLALKVLNLLHSDIGRPINDLQLPIKIAGLESRVLRVMESGCLEEEEVQDRSGNWHILRLLPYYNQENRVDGTVLVLIDITAAKVAQLELRASFDYIEAILETTTESLVVLDRDFQVRSANHAFYETFNVEQRETRGVSFFELGNKQWDIPPIHNLLDSIKFENASFRNYEVEHTFPSIGYRVMRLNGLRIFHKGLNNELILLSIYDITEAHKKELALKEADRLKNEFLAMLAHELRNPLSAICSGIKFLGLGLSHLSEDTLKSINDVMGRQSQHMIRLIEDLLEASRMTSGKIVLRPELVSVESFITSAIESSRQIIDERKHTLTVKLPTKPVFVLGDPVRLSQIVSNLLSNAAKYTNKAGYITLSAEEVEHSVVIRVSDTGVGIRKDLLPKIFDLFTQLDPSLDRAQGGLGIGLTLVRRLVDMHGGTVEATSEGEQKGSQFTVTLPLSSEKPTVDQNAPSNSRASMSVTPRRILVVDDRDDSAQMLAMFLRELGHSVQIAGDGEGAIRVAEEFKPDVMFLDIGLPGMDGYEVARRLRQSPTFHETKLIALTGYGDEKHVRMSKEAGFDSHMVKPMDFGLLGQELGCLFN